MPTKTDTPLWRTSADLLRSRLIRMVALLGLCAAYLQGGLQKVAGRGVVSEVTPRIGILRSAFSATFAAFTVAAAASPPERPEWAYPMSPAAGAPPSTVDSTPLRVPGSERTFSASQVSDRFSPPDWHPEEHGPMPEVVSHGRKPAVFACAYCHLPNGAGRSENASLAGLTAGYIVSQVYAMKLKQRLGTKPSMTGLMNAVAAGVSDPELQEAAEYFSRLSPRHGWIRVQESQTAPRTHVIPINVLAATGDGLSEPLGRRIIEIPIDTQRTERRDSQSGYIAYVPPGSLEQGRRLALGDKIGPQWACSNCHGSGLIGAADIPYLAGRSPSYLFRQLFDIKFETRTGPTVALMRSVVANLDEDDMLALAAYAASLSSPDSAHHP